MSDNLVPCIYCGGQTRQDKQYENFDRPINFRICNACGKQVTAYEMWYALGDIPVDDDDNIDQQFLHFPIGTFREEIWQWFERVFDISVAEDLMGLKRQEDMSVYERSRETVFTAQNLLMKALDGIDIPRDMQSWDVDDWTIFALYFLEANLHDALEGLE